MSSIVTFYSFKGGVGRTMALANIAVLLAQQGLRVLAVDWDLEAPGLDRYFRDFEINSDSEWTGLLDLLIEASTQTERPNWRNHLSRVKLSSNHSLYLLTSGRQDETYAGKVLSFNWEAFFKEAGGGNFIESLREDWRNEFDVTLIDSRTGITDSGGICTIQLPDVLVPVFTTNEQSLKGAKDIALRAQKARQKLAFDRMPLLVVPLPSRFEGRTQFKEAKDWLKTFAKELAPFYKDWLPRPFKPIQILERTKIPYIAYYSFGEKLPVVTDGTSDPEGLGYAYMAMATLIGEEFKNAERLIADSQQSKAMNESEVTDLTQDSKIISSPESITADEYAYDVYISYPRVNFTSDWVEQVVTRLQVWLSENLDRDAKVFLDKGSIELGTTWPRALAEALQRSRSLVAFLTPSYFRSSWCLAEWESFSQREIMTGYRTTKVPTGLITPIVLSNGEHFPSDVKNIQWVDLREHFIPSPAFWQTNRAVELDSIILQIAREVARSVKNAPPFSPDFPIISNVKTKLGNSIIPHL